ncbi:DNA methyltransferase [Azovibrio restrictus]|uniref:DNA methyltransferase n=1 Tax=Azovibrio restrictus TaxID=146938 RepID=UPI0026EC218F|nr:DNA methyltransferase [Azovibrio restrictus]
MTNKQNPKFQELVAKLREIFQIDRPELDFGIYRILNARAGEINDYLENRLFDKVQAALTAGGAASVQQWQAELQEAEKHAQALGVSPDASPKVQELRAKLKEAAAGSSEHENAVFSHLLTFFSRYYQDGDFISQRRYKGDTYAIPYAGEEVLLYWANKDQYYTKSGEHFSNYRFKLEDGRHVHFRLVAADTAKDNRKDNDKDRRFALVAAKTITRVDDNGDEYEEELLPVEEATGSDGNPELIIRFEYAAQPKGTKQEALVKSAVETVLSDPAVKARWLCLSNRAPTEKNPQRTLLEKHLTDYTAKNTADYFIHKDLGGFLRRELDFYIKNEVMHLDDVQNATAFADIEKNLRMIQCLRAIALELIGFLAQLEDFQKKLWLKKKFVVSSHYCITLDRIFGIKDEKTRDWLISEIAANEKQWAQWKQLGVWEGDEPGTVEDLKARLYWMVDTVLFTDDFKQALLACIDDLDDCLDGVIINADNFQALALLAAKMFGSVDFVYIDPPYNATTSEIAYKNGFKHGSWITLMENRLSLAKALMRPDAPVCVAIDENEREHLSLLMKDLFSYGELTQISVIHNPRGIQGNGFSVTNEYAIFFRPEGKLLGKRNLDDSKSKPLMKTGSESERHTAKNCFYPIFVKNGMIFGFGDVPDDSYHPSGACIEGENGVLAVWPISSTDGLERKWRYARQSVEAIIDSLEVKMGRNGLPSINLAKDKEAYRTVWSDAEFNAAEYGSTLLKNIIPGNGFSYPKSLYTVRHAITAANCRPKGSVLDFFSGSGTTAHAVISLNRDEGLGISYVMVEQGDYFDTVLKPRLQKVVYSYDWRDGKPIAPETGISHCFKVLKLESYEDTLNNLQLRRTSAQGELLITLPQEARDDYLLHYLLDMESRGSLLSVDDFKKPFDYTLNIAVDSAGAYEPRKIDLVETFNYLIGLRVKHIDMQMARGFVTVTGTLPSGETCLVLWRDCEKLDYEGVSKLCDKLAINPADNEFDVVYINGDHNIPTVLTQTAEEGGATRVLKLRQIEPEFLERMFSVEDV